MRWRGGHPIGIRMWRSAGWRERRVAGRLWCQAKFVVKHFNFGPIDLKPDQLARCSVARLFQQRLSADELVFLQVDQLPQPDLVRRKLLRVDQRLLTARVIHIDQDQPGFDARHIERQHSRCMDVELAPGVH